MVLQVHFKTTTAFCLFVFWPSKDFHYLVAYLFSFFFKKTQLPVVFWFYHFSIVMRFVNSCIDPFIYAAKYGEFQKGVKRMVTRLRGNHHQIQPQQNTEDIAVASNPTTRHAQMESLPIFFLAEFQISDLQGTKIRLTLLVPADVMSCLVSCAYSNCVQSIISCPLHAQLQRS